MPETVRRLREEHHLMRRLLDIVEAELRVFDEAGEPDYDLLLEVADYCMAFPARHHHPREDLLLARLKERDPLAAEAVGDLEREHGELLALASRVHAALDGVARDVELPRSTFDHIMRNFLGFYRSHIEKEEELFLPAAERTLTAEDWAELDAQLGERVNPLSTAGPGRAFESLIQALGREGGGRQVPDGARQS